MREEMESLANSPTQFLSTKFNEIEKDDQSISQIETKNNKGKIWLKLCELKIWQKNLILRFRRWFEKPASRS